MTDRKPVKTIISLCLWFSGTIFFLTAFCILAVSLTIMPRSFTFSLALAKQTLDRGLSIAILPEGHRTRTGKMGPFKKGPFHLAKSTCAPLVPFGISGLYEFQHKGGFAITPGEVTVRIGRPILSKEYAHLSVNELRSLMFRQIQALAA